MPRSEALIRAMKKYEQEKVDQISLRVPKGKRQLIQEFAAKNQESVNAFINRLIDEALAANQKPNSKE